MTHVDITVIVFFASALLLGGFFWFLYRQKRRTYLLLWAIGWCLFAAKSLAAPLLTGFASPRAVVGIAGWLLICGALAFYCATRLYAARGPATRWVIGAGAAAAVWALAYSQTNLPVPPGLGAAIILSMIAYLFWREARKRESQSDLLLMYTFAVWAALRVFDLFQPRIPALAAKNLSALDFLPELFAGALTLMAAFEEERRRVERNMVALSNLNLATSSFVGSEIQKMLAQGLERVLNVARIPSGALCLHYGEPRGPKSVVATGMTEGFSATIQEENLDEYLVNVVTRLGGFVVMRELARDSKWAVLEKEESFRQLRRLLLAQNLRTVVGVSLQAKERTLGVLLLGTPDHRSFTPAECRLLLALGHQIGTAVENSYLIQQTSRRSEELHILNEIGRALSSTLEPDALFDRIYTEMRRLLEVESFFIALHDSKTQTIRFEIKLDAGDRRDKFRRPTGNHMVEYIIRTGQPLLIRENFDEETRRRGFHPLNTCASLCAVPLILRNETIGAVGVYSKEERAFDEGHVELLRVLASEAAIAIENARLFSEEQKKSRQLSLINAVSRHAITTLDPEEMLAKITLEIEKELFYDHIGIATLDYSSKELTVKAEAGPRREALGLHIPLGDGLIGQVARTGEAAAVREVSVGTPRTVLPGSAAALALPVTYAEQLLGVLYVECSDPCDFGDQETQLLQTLADLFAGALHNAMNFQKAQEQAITDGLTGVKTHRYLMEELSREWKRSTRANRQFALVLMDLDRFKFVNDFYGHLEGDVVLQRVGHILEQNCRRSDVVARYGGDEFVILMPETTIEQARQLANKLRGWVASDPLLRDKNITASFGIASFPLHGSTPQELIQVADSSMYLSKHQGGNSVSSAEQGDSLDRKRWKKDVLEAYLGVTLKRLFSTGPEAFEEIYRRLQQFTRSLEQSAGNSDNGMPPAVVETITSLAFAVDAKDQYTQGHSQKVSAYAAMLAKALGRSADEIEEIRLAAMLHDIGKVGIPETILNKAGSLDAHEWETMKTHTHLGAKILEPLHGVARMQKMIRHHHEFFDGTGYPDQLEGDSIPYGARVIAIADSYDTITSERTYKKARTPDDALRELERCAGSQFDPELVRVFIETMRRSPRPIVNRAPVPDHADTPTA